MELSITKSQMEKIKYEAMLLGKSIEQMYSMAPQMFITEKINIPIKEEILPNKSESKPEENPKYLTGLEDKGYPDDEDFEYLDYEGY